MSVLRLCILLSLLILAANALANPILVMSWEDCDIPVLGMSGTGTPPIDATITEDLENVNFGARALQLVRTQASGPASAYLACVYGLAYNDGFDLSLCIKNEAPVQINVRYCNTAPGDLDPDDGWVTTFEIPQGLEYQEWSFGIETQGPSNGVVVELVLPGDLGATAWVDDMVISGDEVWIDYPCYSIVATDGHSFTQVKDLFR